MEDKHALGDSAAEIKHEQKQNRKIDLSLYMSIGALVVATLQFIISTPFFTEYYYKAAFEVVESEPTIHERSYTTNYTISNPSKNNVNNVEIGIQTLKGDAVQILPNPNIQVTYKDNGPMLKNCYFTIDKLIPNENIVVMVHSNVDTIVYYNNILSSSAKAKPGSAETGEMARAPNGDVLLFPAITLAKFEKGFATIKRQPQRVSNLAGK